MELLRALAPRRTAHAHCDIPCGVYDPAQARIEAESCYRIIEKYQASSDEVFRARCLIVKEERAELAKHHIDVLWSDYFKPEHLEKFPDIQRHVLEGGQAGVAGEAHGRPRGGEEAAGAHRQDRRGVEGHERPGHDPPAGLTARDRSQIDGALRGAVDAVRHSMGRVAWLLGGARCRSRRSRSRACRARYRARLAAARTLLGGAGGHRGAEHGADHHGRRLAAGRPAGLPRPAAGHDDLVLAPDPRSPSGCSSSVSSRSTRTDGCAWAGTTRSAPPIPGCSGRSTLGPWLGAPWFRYWPPRRIGRIR